MIMALMLISRKLLSFGLSEAVGLGYSIYYGPIRCITAIRLANFLNPQLTFSSTSSLTSIFL